MSSVADDETQARVNDDQSEINAIHHRSKADHKKPYADVFRIYKIIINNVYHRSHEDYKKSYAIVLDQ